jgi:hypothetical protein
MVVGSAFKYPGAWKWWLETRAPVSESNLIVSRYEE